MNRGNGRRNSTGGGRFSVARGARTARPRPGPARNECPGALLPSSFHPGEKEEYLRTSDMIIIPVESLEQHGKHLPLNSDIVEATLICLRIEPRTRWMLMPLP